MDAYLLEWLNLLGRWVHMITGIAWIGASFYFVWLDAHLHAPRDRAEGERLGVFGAPTFVLDGERFWGQDRLDFVDRALAAKASTARG